MSTLLKPQDLNMITSDAEMERIREERAAKNRKDQIQEALKEAFMSRDVHPEAIDRINSAVSIAAEQGHHQLQVLTFPSRYCSDGGRRINIADPEWPTTLEGFAKKAYDYFQKELKPLGYKLHAEIINFPGGMPGDVALILKW